MLYLTGWATGAEHIARLASRSAVSIIYAASLSDFRAAPRQCRFIRRTNLGYLLDFTIPAAAPQAEVAA